MRRPFSRPFPGSLVVRDRRGGEPSCFRVPRDDLGLGPDALGEAFLQHLGDARVQLLARALEQRLVRRLLDQRMLEDVGGRGRLPAREEDFGIDQARQPVAQGGLVEPRHRREQRIPELPSQHRRPLRHLLRRREPIEPRHQTVGEAGRDGRHAARRPGLRRRLGQLLDVERHAVGAGDQDIERGGGQLRTHERCDHVVRLALGEPGELHGGQIGMRRPGRRELRARRGEEQHPRRRALRDHVPQQLQRRGVAPLQVLDEHDQRLHRAQGQTPLRQEVDRLPPLQLGANV